MRELSVRKAFKFLGLHYRDVRRLVATGVLPEARVTPTQLLVWTEDELRAACVSFDYKNHRDEERRVWITACTARLTTEPTEYYQDSAPKIHAWDVDRAAWRIYSIDRIIRWHHGTI